MSFTIEFESKIVYRASDRQNDFHASLSKFRLFGGAAGPGKSLALLMEAIRQAHLFPGVNTLIVRRTFPALEQDIIQQFKMKIPRKMYKSYSETKHTVYWLNGSTTQFRAIECDQDLLNLEGSQFLFIGFDELTHFTWREWYYMTIRNRCAIPGSFACMAGATNPGNKGHVWVKALWIDHCPAPGMELSTYDANDYSFIPARLADNPYLVEDKEYRKTLMSLPEAERNRLLEGSWETPVGQYFSNFVPDWHTKEAKDVKIEPWWPRWISIDWGFSHSSVVYWHTKGGENEITYTYREYHTAKEGEYELGESIVSLTPKVEREFVKAVFLSPDAFSKRGAAHTQAQQIGDALKHGELPRPIPAIDDRVPGWRFMSELLEWGSWIIFKKECPELIKAIPSLVRKKDKPEDIAKTETLADDCADAARYGLVSMLAQGHKPDSIVLSEKMEKIPKLSSGAPNYTRMNIVNMEWKAEQKKKRNSKKGFNFSVHRRRTY